MFRVHPTARPTPLSPSCESGSFRIIRIIPEFGHILRSMDITQQRCGRLLVENIDAGLRVELTHLGRLATTTVTTKERIMNFKDWEVIIQRLSDTFNLEKTEWDKDRVLVAWRKSLGKESHQLEPYEIDEIVREVRRRCSSVHQQPDKSTSSTQATSTVSRKTSRLLA